MSSFLEDKLYTSRESCWKTFDGKEIAIKDLSDDHLFNLLVYVEKRCEYNLGFRTVGNGLDLRQLLKEEVALRGLKKAFESNYGRSLWANPTIVEKSTVATKTIAKVLNKYEITQEEIAKEEALWKERAEAKKNK